MKSLRWIAPCIALGLAGCASRPGPDSTPPPAPREFRGAWVASVSNIDWPSKPGLSTEEQLREMSLILQRAADLRLNALIVQVRPACDALYPSPLEPWSEYLTGQQGKAPQPMYDPLATWIQEAHKRGIELHAWFNPYRARHISARSPDAPSHISRTRPELVRKFNGYEWCDPGEDEVQRHTLAVILDVVRRYDVDGIHIDDYFYPYAQYLNGADFPDEPSWQKYRQAGGNLSRADWRRQSVNKLVRGIHEGIKSVKPWVKFGISPFGIWRPNNPAGVTGLDVYEKLYADSRLWLSQGWCDYLSPQLYWPVASKGQPFSPLLQWWISQNPAKRHIWPGLHTSLVGREKNPWPAGEILQQVSIARSTPGAGGVVHFSMKALVSNYGGIADSLRAGAYAQGALVPASPWLGANAMVPPAVSIERRGDALEVRWTAQGPQPSLWGLWTRSGGQWYFSVYPAHLAQVRIAPQTPPVDAVGVMAVDRVGNASAPAVVKF